MQLQQLREALDQQTHYKFYSTSLLLVYEGQDAESNDRAACVVKMIDFAQTQLGGVRDDGYLLGLTSLERVLEDVLRETEALL